MSEKLKFINSKSEQDILDTYKYDVEAFSDSVEFKWSVDGINELISGGWELFSAKVGSEIVAAVFVKSEGKTLLTKSTPVKLLHQGNGYSHEIKNFIEKVAKKQKKSKVINYCANDNFRGISLNESHGYVKTETALENGAIAVWAKDLK